MGVGEGGEWMFGFGSRELGRWSGGEFEGGGAWLV